MLTLQGKALLVLPDKLPEKTKGGLLVPETVKEKPITGIVKACGPICKEVEVGKRIMYARKAASIVTMDGIDYNLIAEDKTFYIYE